MCIIRFDWSIALYIFTLLPRNASFLIVKTVVSGKKSAMLWFFFRQNFNRSLCKNIFLVSSHSCPLPLVRAPPHLTLSPSPNTLLLCPFLSYSPSTASPFVCYTISNAFNSRSTSWIILADEGVPFLIPIYASVLWRFPLV